MSSFINFARKILIASNADEFWYHREKYLHGGIFKEYHRLRCAQIQTKRNASIPMSAVINGKPIFPHGLNGILISSKAVVGKNVKIYQQVTIGAIETPTHKRFGAPIIGDNCELGAGGKVIGAVRIGNNVRIGANCVVVDDVADDCTVVMPKARVIDRKNRI